MYLGGAIVGLYQNGGCDEQQPYEYNTIYIYKAFQTP